MLTVAGNPVGAYLQIVALGLGAGALALASVSASEIVKPAGAAHLVFLGVQAIRHRRRLSETVAGWPW